MQKCSKNNVKFIFPNFCPGISFFFFACVSVCLPIFICWSSLSSQEVLYVYVICIILNKCFLFLSSDMNETKYTKMLLYSKIINGWVRQEIYHFDYQFHFHFSFFFLLISFHFRAELKTLETIIREKIRLDDFLLICNEFFFPLCVRVIREDTYVFFFITLFFLFLLWWLQEGWWASFEVNACFFVLIKSTVFLSYLREKR